MLNKPINHIVKEHFINIRNVAKRNAELDFKANVKDKIKGLDDFQKLSLCLVEDERIKKLKQEDPHPYYFNHGDDWLLNQFANRHFLLNVDETDEFIQSVSLSDYDKLLYKEIKVIGDKIPKLTYEGFLKGVRCKYYESFDFQFNIEEKDYYQIADWQMKGLLDIVEYDTTNVIKAYQGYCKTLENPIEFIEKQLAILEDELSENLNDSGIIKQILSKLYIFFGFDFNTYKDELLLLNLPIFYTDENNFRKLNPETLKEPLFKMASNITTVVGNEFTIFYTLDILQKWMQKIIKGHSLDTPFKFIDTDKELEKAIQEAELESQEVIDEINDYCFNDTAKSDKQIKKYLRTKFEEEMHAYNKVQDERVFFLLREENKELQKANVKFNYIINDKLQEVLQEIKIAYKIQNTSWQISFIFEELFNSKTMYYKRDSVSHITIQSLMNKMVVDKELHNELKGALDTFFNRFYRDSMPLDMHFINHRETYIRVFEKSMERFQKILDNAEPSNKILYIQSRLKELKHRELQFRSSINKKGDFKNKEDKYPNLFKDFLSIEAEFIKETAAISPLTYLPVTSKILIDKPKFEKFEEFLSTEKQTYVLQMLEDLAITVDGYYALSPKKLGAIRGVVEALREQKIISHMGLHKICVMFADKINATMKSELDASTTSEDYKKAAIEYIKNNPLH
ncbi:hypothetical protein MQE36_05780 [Zhouia spongiae]|uniref:Uncharacterized protein n=1 Tax=Zhouia spongiae TaxID=2202721 RepID=A0ABY3YPU4_9FLAO|nr:hypothetical protein [Zhouia spongiae]UNY99855.1 hypothetical protein MQE36_05780 [Zhouia spongiae]